MYPHEFLKSNTVFEVAKAAGLRTAWSDKHPAYEILNGPSGAGVADLFTPEINSDAPARFTTPSGGTGDWTGNNFATRQYDGYKVAAVLNEIDGRDHSGRKAEPVPAIFGMNFQSVSTAEKLPISTDPATGATLAGGYTNHGRTPGPLLRGALDFVDAALARMHRELQTSGLAGSTPSS